jgi:hypothetical protein
LWIALVGTALVHCTPAEPAPAKPAPPPPPTAPAPAPSPAPAPADKPALEVAAQPAPAEAPTAESPPEPKPDIYSGTHKLGVNRVTDMARTGTARFSRKGGELHLQGRAARGKHWLELSGRVEPQGPNKFVLTGTIRGVPDMAWAGEAPRERTSEGRFTFEVRKGRPYWRIYEVNGRECVCHDDCGNDFCYIDLEQQPIAEDAQPSAK